MCVDVLTFRLTFIILLIIKDSKLMYDIIMFADIFALIYIIGKGQIIFLLFQFLQNIGSFFRTL